jgi:hypothetical protein
MRDSLRASQLSRGQKVKPPGKTHTQQFPQNTTKDILIQELSEYSSDADQSNFYDSNYNLKTNRTQGLGNTYTASKVNTGRKIDYSNSKL